MTRYIHAPPERVWSVFKDQLSEWWQPKPLRTVVHSIEWRTGGIFDTTIYGPNGESRVRRGLFLEVAPQRRIVFTDAIFADKSPSLPYTLGVIRFAADSVGTRYRLAAQFWCTPCSRQRSNTKLTDAWRLAAKQLAALAEDNI
ncbi:SRPBCC domain-containing protein [Saccharophagus degradans]|uniref:SRPBCC domain-containing protein n=1 Tax=Saccharophagus degradans TaxID=86304 RepID=A0AAW7X9W6_9GAMM|nr:SRPBCC domain-containing protein [Saccharophagus degradans]MBU2987023.1 SRPBCC domain-containing protein [Saccharophagus degradans]MDO6424427.1 SRPBCC domain-containing protein [Saccharophagus degradans]MDO6608366.1 SRPBCC domain-containing protein [Saccharophagus degradans]